MLFRLPPAVADGIAAIAMMGALLRPPPDTLPSRPGLAARGPSRYEAIRGPAGPKVPALRDADASPTIS